MSVKRRRCGITNEKSRETRFPAKSKGTGEWPEPKSAQQKVEVWNEDKTSFKLPVRVFREADNANVLPLYATRRQDGGLWKNRKASNRIKIIMSTINYIM